MKTIDTHAHLDHLPELDQALEDAYQSGVEGIVCVSMDLKSCQRNLEIKRKKSSPKIYLAMGMHPSEANLVELDNVLQMIKDNATDLTAIGEIGLDFWYKWVKKDDAKKDEQRHVFRRHLELAIQLKLPVIVHSRGAWRECFETVKEMGLKKAVFHWYSGPLDVLDDITAAGYFVGASPSLAYSPQSREAISHADIHHVLMETDSPVYYSAGKSKTFLTAENSFPAQQRRNDDRREEFSCKISDDEGFQSQPKDVVRTLKAYCALMNLDLEKTASVLNQNARNCFNI